jgi:hypothetical protein
MTFANSNGKPSEVHYDVEQRSCLVTITTDLFIPEQDAGLDALSAVINRQKQMALDIGNEVDTQNGEVQLLLSH